jgi:hypothetical protein
VLPSVKVPVAVNDTDMPTVTEPPAGVTAIETKAGALTVKPVEPTIAPRLAVIVTDPGATLVPRPEAFTVATAEFIEPQVTELVRFCSLPSV